MNPTSKLNQLKKLNDIFSQRKNQVYSKLAPACHHYYSDLIPVNLFELTDPQNDLEGISEILVRDGLFTLIDFFQRFPEPASVKTRLLIHEWLISFVPLPWRKQVKAYTYLVNRTKNKPAKGLIIKGIISDAMAFEESLPKDLIKTYEKVYFMPSSRPSLFTNSGLDQQLVVEKLLVKTWDEIKAIFPQVKIVTTSDIRLEMDFSDTEFYSIGDSGLHYTDDSTCLYLLARGSRPVKIEKIQSSETSYSEISPHHGVLISEPQFTESLFENTISDMEHLKLNLWTSDGYGFLNQIFRKIALKKTKWHAYDI